MRAFMDGYRQSIDGIPGISKISIQTGTSHGGVVLSDGTLADVAIDFDVLAQLGDLARREYGMGGAVQHGASTLPETAFGKFVECRAVEVHLATAFQTLVYEHESVPRELIAEMREWLFKNALNERKASDSDEQFIYKTRKKAIGPFKREFWNLPEPVRMSIGMALEARFSFLFDQLCIGDTVKVVNEFVHPAEIHLPAPTSAIAEIAAEEVEGLSD
jgi:hypothetical protein